MTAARDFVGFANEELGRICPACPPHQWPIAISQAGCLDLGEKCLSTDSKRGAVLQTTLTSPMAREAKLQVVVVASQLIRDHTALRMGYPIQATAAKP